MEDHFQKDNDFDENIPTPPLNIPHLTQSNDEKPHQPTLQRISQNFQYISDSNLTSLESVSLGSQQNLIPSAKKTEKNYEVKDPENYPIPSLHQLESGQNTPSYNHQKKCSDTQCILFLILSLLAPPFYLVIALGYLDSTFGRFDRKYKIISAAMFTICLIGSVVGIAVGLGVGMTR